MTEWNKPWHQKYPLDPTFPFELMDVDFADYPCHWHKYLEIMYLEKGNMVVFINGKTYDMHEGDIVVVNSDVIHGYFDTCRNTHTILILFGLELFDQLWMDLKDKKYGMVVFNRKIKITAAEDPDVYPQMVQMIRSVRNEFVEKKDGYRIAIKKTVYEIALLFLRKMPLKFFDYKKNVIENFSLKILERIFSYLHEYYVNPDITLDKAAAIANLSRFYFSRFFREKTGMTFHTYLSRLRINKAKELLLETDMTITDIAYYCGFNSLKTFNRLFKNYIGASPSAYRAGAHGHYANGVVQKSQSLNKFDI